MIVISDRAFLRLHIEAVWEITIPPLEGMTVELAETAPLPPWTLYQANLADGLVTILRPDVPLKQRADLLARSRVAGVVFDAALSMRREVVLRAREVAPTPPAHPQHNVRLLVADDAALLEAFEAGSSGYFLDPQHAPCFGVIVARRLVSVAHSSRRTRSACELGINTLPEARRQGYATTAVRAWTAAILHEELTPIYSAFAHNTASLRLAATAGYAQVSESVYGPVAEAQE